MKGKTIVIGLVSDRIDVLLCQGSRVVARRRIPLALTAPAEDPGKWGRDLVKAASAVRTAAAEMGAAGAAATVLYRSPTEAIEYTTQRVKSSSEARDAAILGCADSLHCSLDMAAYRSVVVGRDATGEPAPWHVIVSADTDETVNDVATMVDEAELDFTLAAPIDAANMSQLISKALHHSGPNCGFLYVGEHRSFFVIAGGGTLLFARPINLGIDALVSSLTLPIRATAGSDPIQLDQETGREILHSFGFAERSQVVHEEMKLTGGQVLPLLQPVLQRFIVEIRQSLRFALPESERQSVKLLITGPGSAIPGFGPILATELQLAVDSDTHYAKFDWRVAGSEGSELLDAIENRKSLASVGLQPRRIAKSRDAKRMRHWLWTGAVAALLMIGFDTARFQMKLGAARQRAQVAASQTDELQRMQSSAAKMLAAITSADKLEQAIAREIGSSVNVCAAMHELSRLTPESIRLTSVSFHQDAGRAVGIISGYAVESKGASPGLSGKANLEPYIDALRRSPLFESVSLANVQVGSQGEISGQRFQAKLAAVPIPHEAQTAVVVGSSESVNGAPTP